MIRNTSVRILKITLLILLWVVYDVSAQFSQGTVSPCAVANETSPTCPFAFGAVVPWTNPSNTMISNDTYATHNHCNCCDEQTPCLFATDFPFTIPLGATINGIEVHIEKHRSGPVGEYVEDNGLFLVKGGNVAGGDRAEGISTGQPWGTNNWSMTDAVTTYGSPIDLWDTTWTPADINASNFGVAFSSINYTLCNTDMMSFVDHISITVYCTLDPNVPFTASFTTSSTCFGDTVNFIDNSSGGPASWNWDFGDGNTATSQNPIHSYTAEGTYPVKLRIDKGCLSDSITSSVVIATCIPPDTTTAVFIPNTFSPNGDGFNDLFVVRGSNITEIQLAVYNRWGEKVFETDDVTTGWDGKYKSKQVVTGIFIYHLNGKFIDGKPFSKQGAITIIK